MLSIRCIPVLLLSLVPTATLAAESRKPEPALRGALVAEDENAKAEVSPRGQTKPNPSTATKPSAASTADKAADEGAVDTWNIFGFTQGSDVGAKGEHSISVEAGRGWLRRGRAFAGLRGSIQYAYGAANRLNLAGTLSGDTEQQRGPSVPAAEPGWAAASVGLSGTAKYQLLKRGEAPIGLSVEVTPYALRGSETEGARTQTLGAELRLSADAALIPNRVYAAANLSYGAERTTAQPWRVPDRASEIGASAALSYAVANNLFIGPELRYLASYSGFGLDAMNGWAVFLGPTLYLSLGQGYLGAAWSVQVAGRAAGERSASLDLTKFERHQFLLKTGFSF